MYQEKLHLQPLPLFNIDHLFIEVAYLPQYLLRSFLAITLLFTEHPFYGTAKNAAIEFYIRTARETVVFLATEGELSLQTLQTLCLLALSDAAGDYAFEPRKRRYG